MALKDITIGDKTAKPVGARFIKSEKGTLGFEVAFQFMEPATGRLERLNWVGWLSEKALDHTMDTLVSVLGYNGSESTDENGFLTDSQVLDFEREVKLVVEQENYNGKSFPKIKWVNTLGGSMFAGVSPQSIKADLATVGFKGAFLTAKRGLGLPDEKKRDMKLSGNDILRLSRNDIAELSAQDLPF